MFFSADEYERRIEALQRRMADARIDVLLIDQFEHLAYFTGYVPTAAMYQACLLPLGGDPIMVARALDAPMLEEQSWVRRCVTFADTENPVDVVAAVIRRQNWADQRIGVENDSHFLLVSRLRRLQAALPAAEFADFSGHMWELRLRKSAAEIQYLEQCAKISDEAAAAGIRAVREGIPERDVAAEIYSCALRAGADNTRLLLMGSGPRSNNMHGGLGNRVLAAGDLVRIEMVPHYCFYTARLIRMVSVNEPAASVAATAQRLIEIQDEQYAAMKPGVQASHVDRVLRAEVLRAKLRDDYTTITGYTLGLGSIPRTSDFTRVFLPDSAWVLEAGMVFHMYAYAQGIWFSDTIHVTPDGAQRLTRLERRLFVR
jgi:Xaa-Pro dipeptidase